MRTDYVHGYSQREEARLLDQASTLAEGLLDAAAFQRGVDGLRRAAGPDGVFCYTFFKGVGVR